MPRFYETTLSITNLHNLSISTHVNRSRIDITSFILHQLPKLRVAGSNPVFRSENRGKKRR